ncbi:MAG TPA: DinB family protein [Thermoanaerobaculia bacterium]|nr:DinB family protein [Thermoanaerobaculia bacterium]
MSPAAPAESTLPGLAAHYLGEYLAKIEAALAPLADEQLWWRPAESTNAIGNLLLHLHGNLSQWVLDGLGGREYTRRRGEEFAARAGAPKGELLAALAATVAACREAAAALPAAELARVRTIQGYDVDGARALFHAVEHMSYHTGQIVLLAKALGAELDFYPQHRGE